MSEKKAVKCWMDPSGLVYDDSERYLFTSDHDNDFLSPAVAVPQEAYNKARGLLSRIADRGGSDTAYLDTIEVLALLPEVPHV